MLVEDVSVFALDIPLTEPFEISLGTKERAANVIVRIETASGTVGYGEGAPLEPITGETQETALAAARSGATLLEGRDLRDRRAILEDLRAALPGTVSSIFALETAVYDTYCREQDIALAELFGNAAQPVRTDMTIPMVDPDTAATSATTATEAGFETLKVKVGSDIESDLDRLERVQEAAPDAELTVDANQGWTPKEAIRFVDRLGDRGIELHLLEQPVRRDDLAGLARVTDTVRVPVAADEAVFTPADATQVVRREAADVITIKGGKSGLIDSLAIAEIARSANLSCMVGCMLESAIGVHASAHLVAGLGGVSVVDLDGNVTFASHVDDIDIGPTLAIDGPGHGIVPDADMFSKSD